MPCIVKDYKTEVMTAEMSAYITAKAEYLLGIREYCHEYPVRIERTAKIFHIPENRGSRKFNKEEFLVKLRAFPLLNEPISVEDIGTKAISHGGDMRRVYITRHGEYLYMPGPCLKWEVPDKKEAFAEIINEEILRRKEVKQSRYRSAGATANLS